MSQDNPFAKLGAIDQKLFQETAPKPAEKAAEKESIAKSHTGKPDVWKTRNPANWHNQNS